MKISGVNLTFLRFPYTRKRERMKSYRRSSSPPGGAHGPSHPRALARSPAHNFIPLSPFACFIAVERRARTCVLTWVLCWLARMPDNTGVYLNYRIMGECPTMPIVGMWIHDILECFVAVFSPHKKRGATYNGNQEHNRHNLRDCHNR